MSVTMEELIVSLVDKRFEERKEEIIEEIKLDLVAEQEQSLFSQTELANHFGVSTKTIYKWRKAGLQSEPSMTSELRFDIQKVQAWRFENDKRKIR